MSPAHAMMGVQGAATTDLADWLGSITIGQAAAALLPILGALAFLVRLGWRAWSQTIKPAVAKLRDFLDDWNGVPDRPGVVGRHGVMSRLEHQREHLGRVEVALAELQHEVKPNSGRSLRDVADRIETTLTEHMTESTQDRAALHAAVDQLAQSRADADADRHHMHSAVDALTTETDEHHHDD